MLHVFCGSDTVAVRKAALASLESFEERGIVPTKLESETYQRGALEYLLGGVSLFGDELVCVLDTPTNNVEFVAVVTDSLPALALSGNVFVLIESAPLAAYRKALQKYATSFTELKAEAKAKGDPFAFGNAFSARDKKMLWIVLCAELRSGTPPELLVGSLWRQLKLMRLAAMTNDYVEAGLEKEYPYKVAKAALRKYSLSEVERLSRELLAVYHDGHSEKGNIAVGLERWCLRV